MIVGSKYANHDLARFLAINNKVNKVILYDLAVEFIIDNKLEMLKLFHRLTGYDFGTPKYQQSLMNLASGWASSHNNVELFNYILDNGGKLEERDYSEHWQEWLRYPEYMPHIHKDENGEYYITGRGLILANEDTPGNILRLLDN